MKLTWLGHSGFRIEIADQILLVDPWFTGNPSFPADRRAEAIAGATAILVSHGHSDHATDAGPIAKELGIPVAAIYELAVLIADKDGVDVIGFNKGGTIRLGEVAVTLVNATHSSSFEGPDGRLHAGSECGFMIAGEGQTIYFSGDTDVMSDMALFEELHSPDIGILCAGGFYTMDMERAAWAAQRFFNFSAVIPCHYATFPALAQSADPMRAALPNTRVLTPAVMESVEL